MFFRLEKCAEVIGSAENVRLWWFSFKLSRDPTRDGWIKEFVKQSAEKKIPTAISMQPREPGGD